MTAPTTTPDTVTNRLDLLLASLGGPGLPFSAETLAELDRAETFPAEACAFLDAFGLRRYYVPVEHGGALGDFSAVMTMLRSVSRADLTVAASHGKTYLGAVSTWIAGEPEAARRLGERITHGETVSCALTERDHGSDLLAGEVTARLAPDGGWLLSGEKWLINSATRAGLVTVLARTAEAGGPRGFSLFLVDKSRLPAGTFSCLPKVPTYGIRGADISGIAFHDAPLPEDALIGAVGQGVETIVKALHLTRTGCAAMSLGAGDQALRLAAEFTQGAQAGTIPLARRPYIRRELGDAAAGLLLADAVGLVAMRSVHALTGEMSVVSAVAKAFVPSAVDEIVARLLQLLGPYGLLGAGDPHGRFAKLERDHRIIGIFDGSSLVNRNALIEQFPRLVRAYRKGRWDEAGLAEATGPHVPLRPFRSDALSLLSGDGASVVAGLADAVAQVRAIASAPLAALTERVLDATGRLHEEMAQVRFAPRAVPAHAFDLAERYELCFAAASALHLWVRTSPAGGDETWLRGCLVKALTELGDKVDDTELDVLDDLADALVSRPPGTFRTLLDHLGQAGPADSREATAS
ncbi:acyl-CoA dehydrogenase [Streptomyces cyaneochromogenes]|uniref:Acyl-CoA dehydrogenase n=1 Tax=Streptomyces cyaneochromogenes TaxID=2496836 RepID=A0A3S9LZ60_9ACTN|nr:acyl-CoA dehydrogenase [Streptomyces cyaneochromogenes]AZQ32228.1 acyl-CoA dehydrogenase [Streptomyces cyaneochromogenes]